jgi:spore germination protein GerM
VGEDEVLIFLIVVGDNGASGPLVGCGDSAVSVRRQIPETRGVLRAALNELLSLHDQFYGESGFYNALYQSSLTLDGVTIVNGTAKIELSGTLLSGGTCDDPRIIAQIEYTARQFSTVRAVEITVNGTDIHDLLSGR